MTPNRNKENQEKIPQRATATCGNLLPGGLCATETSIINRNDGRHQGMGNIDDSLSKSRA